MADRVRFAPSPTGYLHIGGVRTALYNWLWARQTGGTFVLRIEDTDLERSTEASVKVIFESMRWLDLDWDEGPGAKEPHAPYFQTQRLDLYKEHAERLITRGHAYRCFCTKEELDAQRALAQAAGKFFKYPGTCRNRTDQPDKPFVVRLKTPTSGTTGWNDLVKGRIDVPNDQQQDAVIMRGNGVPLYNFGCVVDDVTMGITLVGRGYDHVVNTPPQIMIFEALGAPIPKFAHLPMINGSDGKKLSKRTAAVSVGEYQTMGFLPDAVLNYLARLGWSHGDQEVFSRQELIEKFDWEHCGRTAAQYDFKKFQHIQAAHLRGKTNEDVAKLARPLLKPELVVETDAQLALAVDTVKTRATTLVEVADMVDFYFREPPTFDEKAVEKFLGAGAEPNLGALRDLIAEVSPFDRATLEAAVTAWLEKNGLSLKNVAQPARVALTGKTQSPGLFEVMEVLGKARTLARLDAARARAAQAATKG